MATPESLDARARHVQALFAENGARIAGLQEHFRDTLVPQLIAERSLDALDASRIERFATEPSTIWRFLRRARFDEDDAVGALDGRGRRGSRAQSRSTCARRSSGGSTRASML